MKVLLVAAIAACLWGCAGSYEEPTLPPDHPANPNAPAGQMPAATGTLDVEKADPVPPLHDQGHAMEGRP